jgi:hypothetical protein
MDPRQQACPYALTIPDPPFLKTASGLGKEGTEVRYESIRFACSGARSNMFRR